jgi:hypothetical protein
MRAMRAQTGPRVLRVGVVVGGRLLEERIIKQRTSVTVGPSERAMFVVEADMPPQFKLFERVGADYCLNTCDGMTGRLALPGGVVDLVVPGGRARSAGPMGAIRLTDEARGKVVIGRTTILFQFVTAPPIQARPRLPLSVKDGVASQIDWTLTVIAALSFLAHFGLVGAMYSDWMDAVVNDDITVGLVHTIEPSLPPRVETAPEIEAAAMTTAEAAAAPTGAPATSAASKVRPAPASAPDAALDGLLGDLERVNLAVLPSVNGGPNLQAVMTASDNGAPVDLNALGDRRARIATSEGLDLPAGAGGPIEASTRAFSLRTRDTGGAPSSAGSATRVVVIPDVHEEAPTLSAPVRDAEAVIRKQIHPGARRCYQKGLDSDPSQSGKLVVVIKVGPSGEVESASVPYNSGLSVGVAACIAAVAHRAKFDPTGPGGATIVVPFGFLRQGG